MFFGQILSVTNIALLSLAEYKGAFNLAWQSFGQMIMTNLNMFYVPGSLASRLFS